MITPLPPSRQITTPHLPIDTTAATKEKMPRQMHALDQFCASHTTSYTISLIRVIQYPLKMVLLKEVTVKIRRSSMNKTDSKIYR